MRNLFLKYDCSTAKTLAALMVLAALLGCGGDDDDDVTLEHLQDIEGNVYSAVSIGNQVWMAENLKVTKYNDGTAIPYVNDTDDLVSLTTGAFTWFNDDEGAFKETYGALYNWHVVSSGKLCPAGWHVPSDAEWTTLINFLGGEGVAGGELKAIGTSHWNAPNTGATNNSGFTALPAGYLFDNGNYNSLGNVTHWWTATASDADAAWDRYVHFQNPTATKGNYSKQVFYSCRCVKN
jgi:uncharacterized protein (TIGR02145 family)